MPAGWIRARGRARSWRRVSCAAAAAACVCTSGAVATGQAAPPARGLLVVATDATSDAAWPLAQEVYARPSLRPPSLDEQQARVLAGDAPPAGASQRVRDLAETRAAIRGDDAPSRQLLASTARDLHVRGVVVVTRDGSRFGARVFLADTSAFDAAQYAPDPPPAGAAPPTSNAGSDAGASQPDVDGGILPNAPPPPAPPVTWHAAVDSLERVYGTTEKPAAPAPTAGGIGTDRGTTSATHAKSGKPFYTSPWFWGALGAAAFGAAAVFVATRDNSSGTIHLQMQVPK